MTIVSGYATAERLIAGDKKTCFRGTDRQKEENAMSATISRDELKAKLDRGDKFWLAETLPWGKFQNGHLPGAVNLPPDRIKHVAPQLLPDKKGDIVVYCSSPTCTASEDAARELIALGYSRVRRYVGGVQDWTQAGLPVQREPQMTATNP
jgi:rhodanese-related sulfurtransferase